MGHEIAQHWRLKRQRYSLEGEVCHHCESKIFPPRDICPNCGNEARETFQFSGKGEVFSFTTIYEAPTGFDENTPYTVALVKLNEGPMVTAQLTDLEEQTRTEVIDGEERLVIEPVVRIGMPVEMVTRKLRDDPEQRGVIVYGYKFRPVMESSSPMEVSMSSR